MFGGGPLPIHSSHSEIDSDEQLQPSGDSLTQSTIRRINPSSPQAASHDDHAVAK